VNSPLILGLDIGGTKTAAILGSCQGVIVSHQRIPTEAARGFEKVFPAIVALAQEVMSGQAGPITAISVSIGGPLDVMRGIIQSPPNLPGWDDIPLKDLLAREFGLPVYVEHDGNAGALAESYFGAGKGCRNMVFLTMGTGFGAGLILDGKIYRGTTDVAGEVGHIRIAEDGPMCYGKKGSLEGYASGAGIAKLAAKMFPDMWNGASTVIDVYRAYQNGSVEARDVFERAALYFGRGLAMIADLLNPERIVLGGLGMRLTDALVAPALRVFHHEALPKARDACQVVPAQLGESIGDYAALCAAFDQGQLLQR
jgi:glucokinase